MLTILLTLNVLLVIAVIMRRMGQSGHWFYPIAATVWIVLYVTHPQWLTRVCLVATGAYAARTIIVRSWEGLVPIGSLRTVRDAVKELLRVVFCRKAGYYPSVPTTTHLTSVGGHTSAAQRIRRHAPLLQAGDTHGLLPRNYVPCGQSIILVNIQREPLITNSLLEPWIKLTHTALSSLGGLATAQARVTADLVEHQQSAFMAWWTLIITRTWVAPARADQAVFDEHMPGPNQIHNLQVTAADLLRMPEGYDHVEGTAAQHQRRAALYRLLAEREGGRCRSPI